MGDIILWFIRAALEYLEILYTQEVVGNVCLESQFDTESGGIHGEERNYGDEECESAKKENMFRNGSQNVYYLGWELGVFKKKNT